MNKPMFGFFAYKWGFWIRAFWKGCLVSIDNHPPLFSERNGYVKVWRIGRLKIKRLD